MTPFCDIVSNVSTLTEEKVEQLKQNLKGIHEKESDLNIFL